jgi:hypothetical protein
MDSKKKMLLALVVVLGVLVAIEISLSSHIPPQVAPIHWEDTERIETSLEPFHVRVVTTDAATYLFYTANDPDPSTRSLFYMEQVDGEWSESIRIPLELPPWGTFDCAYEVETGDLYIFYCNMTDSGLSTYMTSGKVEELGPVEVITPLPLDGHHQWIGPIGYSAFFAENGTLYLAYTSLSGSTENANPLYLRTRVDREWNEPVRLGTGNSPAALETADGAIVVYSNLWGYIPGPQHVVDEWEFSDGEWRETELKVTKEDSNVDPFVLEDGRGTRYLLYDHREYTPEEVSDTVVIHSMRQGDRWSSPDIIWSGGERWSLRSVCAVIEEDTINVYWISEGRLYSMEGEIQN